MADIWPPDGKSVFFLNSVVHCVILANDIWLQTITVNSTMAVCYTAGESHLAGIISTGHRRLNGSFIVRGRPSSFPVAGPIISSPEPLRVQTQEFCNVYLRGVIVGNPA